MSPVQISKVSQVLPLYTNSHSNLSDTITLSLHDIIFLVLDPVRNLFLYPQTNLPFPQILQTLKSSLARTLPSFHPLAGKLTYVESSESLIIDCSPEAVGNGVTFLEAESDLDINLLAEEEVQDEAFFQLVPNITPVELPAPVCAIQVTKFSNGGVAVGIAINHGIMDGIGMWQFIDAWVQNCKSWDSPARSTAQHDRSIVKSDGDDEVIRGALKRLFPHLPKERESLIFFLFHAKKNLNIFFLQIKLPDTNKNLHLTRKTFSIDETSIQALQRKILSLDLKRVSNPSKFVSLLAHTWICLTRARATTSNEPMSATSSLFFAIDLSLTSIPPLMNPTQVTASAQARSGSLL
ncbi:hypothetical protein LUZ60_014868 [Juncus effusus]|nr:hypothetical protein LUZ60_014868 [Juncus effusus]